MAANRLGADDLHGDRVERVVREVEVFPDTVFEITRKGEPVAVLLSYERYAELRSAATARTCEFGLTEEEVRARVGDRWDEYQQWAEARRGSGVATAECDGRRWSNEHQEHEPSGCGPHGTVFVDHFVADFLAGRA